MDNWATGDIANTYIAHDYKLQSCQLCQRWLAPLLPLQIFTYMYKQDKCTQQTSRIVRFSCFYCFC